MDKKLRILLQSLIDHAESIGLGPQDLNTAKDYLIHHEFGLCLDTIATQLYEYSLPIDAAFYVQLQEGAKMMKIPETKYSFMKELIK
jgi:L-serine deaminase